ncbi:hypothetical protein V8C86DRAFT_2709339 [Haematococcus lacustris]
MAIVRLFVSSARLAAAAAAASNAQLNIAIVTLSELHMSNVAATVGCSQPALSPSSGHIASSTTSQSSLSPSLSLSLGLHCCSLITKLWHAMHSEE